MKTLEIIRTDVANTYTTTAVATTVIGATYQIDGTEQTVSAPEEQTLVLIVDGAQENLIPGASYEVKEGFEIASVGVFRVGGPSAAPWSGAKEEEKVTYYFRQALLVKDGKIVDDCSVSQLIQGGSFDASCADGITLTSNAPHFNGIILDDGTKYEIKNSKFYAKGDGSDDLSGWGASIMADNKAVVDISDSYIETEGCIRCGLYVDNTAVVTVKDSVLYSKETPDTWEEYHNLTPAMMKRVPFALGMEGTVRTLNVMADGQGIFKDSVIVSTGWGAISCDSGTAYDICGTYCLDCDNVLSGIGTLEVAQEGKEYTAVREIGGVKYGFTVCGSGYVTYADSGVHNRYKNVEFYSPDYIQIMGSGRSGSEYIDSYLYAEHNAFMTQQSAGGTYELTNTKIDTVDALLQIKSGAANTGFSNIIVDNCEINFSGASTRSKDGILVELVESDDAGNPGITTYTINDHADEAEATLSSVTDSNATLKNGSYKGDIYNCIYNYRQELNVSVENATLTGTVSSSTAVHVDLDGKIVPNGTVLNAFLGSKEYDHVNYNAEQGGQDGDCLIIGRFCHTAAPMLNNPINLTLKDAKWVVTGDGYLQNLSVEVMSDIAAETAVTINVKKLTVAGEAKPDGVYTEGNVTIVVDSTVIEAADNGICDAGQTYGNVAYTFFAKTEDGEPDSKAFTVKRQNYIDGKLYYTILPADGYTIVSTSSEGGTISKNTAGGELAIYEDVIAPGEGETAMSVTAIVKR
ncbi:MAG: hypothetical protein LIO39_05040 [Lachnospiraceae bacterium]|nr:hypothetical protein [Lachnospiraceae bacterium]